MDLLIFKMQLLRQLLDHWIDPLKWPSAVKSTIRTVLSSHLSHREHVGYPSDKEKPAQQWRLGFPDSAEEFFSFIEITVYGVENDMVLKGHLKNRKSVQDFDKAGKPRVDDRCTERKTSIVMVLRMSLCILSNLTVETYYVLGRSSNFVLATC